MDTNEQAAPTARLNFGQRVADPAPVENTQTEAVQAEEAQQEAMTAEAEAQPEATVEAEAQTETSEASADVPDAPVTEQLVENSELVDAVNEPAAHEAAGDFQTVEVEVDSTSAENLPQGDLPVPAEQEPEQVQTQDAAVETIEQVSGDAGLPAGTVDDAIDEAEAVNETMDELRVNPPADAEQATDTATSAEEAVEEQAEAPAAPVVASTSGSGKSVEELTAEREKLDAEIKQKQDAEKASVIAQIKQVAETYGVTADELVEAMGGLKSKRKGVKAKPKYRDPATGVIWSGRGKEPAWIKGKKREDFLIAE